MPQRTLLGMPSKALHELMFARGVNLATTPAWQRRRAMVYKMLKKVHGFNPITNETAETLRSSVTIDGDSRSLMHRKAGNSLIH